MTASDDEIRRVWNRTQDPVATVRAFLEAQKQPFHQAAGASSETAPGDSLDAARYRWLKQAKAEDLLAIFPLIREAWNASIDQRMAKEAPQ